MEEFNNITFNLSRLEKVAKDRSEEEIQKEQFRKDNIEWLRISQDIALKLHYYLRKTNISKEDLANQLNISLPYFKEILKGQVNLTLKDIVKIRKIGINF